MKHKDRSDRRDFLRTSAVAGVTLFGSALTVSNAQAAQESKKMVTLQITAKLKPDSLKGLEEFFEKNLPNSRSAKGCRNIVILYDEKKENLLVLEEWLSKEDHQNYVKMISENGVMNTLLTFFDGEPSVQYYLKTQL